jgi:peptidoglycan/xylan/chitin deacetylase (PgdA/CDA1 family)
MRTSHRRLRKSDYPIVLLHYMGMFDLARKFMPRHLTVLNYHRIDDPYRKGFDTFRPNVSAGTAEFVRQMDYVSQNYRVVSGADLVAFINTGRALPPRAALITFDDGYLDNYTNAFPILKSRNLPAIIFLATDYIGSTKPFYWDLVAYCFYHSSRKDADLPCLGAQSWANDRARESLMHRWIEALKQLPEQEKHAAVGRLPAILGVDVPENAFAQMMISWAQAREMSENGIEMGAHTASHPILTRISVEEAASEISRSKRRIEDELNKPVTSFAYPNGQLSDFNREIEERVQQAGLEAAFTLLSGPTRYATVARQPFAIRRIFLSHEDNFSRFVAKLTGIPRIISRW